MSKAVNVFCSVSSREIDKARSWLIPSLNSQLDISEIALHLVNYTGKGRIYEGPEKVGKVTVMEISRGAQCGFGEAHNFAFEKAAPDDFFLVANPDLYCHETCLIELAETFLKNDRAALAEARQLPFEHPKEYDPASGRTPWASGSCVLVRSSFFREVGGFDKNFWMYCEDVDLSWRAWLEGYEVVHASDAVAYHFTGAHYQYRNDRFYLEQFWCARNFIYLMYKYWGRKGEAKAVEMLKKTWYPENFRNGALDSYYQLRSGLPERPPLMDGAKIKHKGMIKVLGFNLYHRER